MDVLIPLGDASEINKLHLTAVMSAPEVSWRRCRYDALIADEIYALSRRRLEPLEPDREPLAVRAMFRTVRKMEGPSIQSLQCFEHRPVVLPEQPL